MPVLHLIDAAIAPASTTTSLLDHVDLTIAPRARCAIIGPNGSGKSTLLAALAAHQPLLSGRRDYAHNATLAFADRGPRAPAHTVEAELLTHRPADAAALANLRSATDPLNLAAALDAWSERGGWHLEADIARALSGIGLANIAPDRPLAELSGGQRQRVELAALLLSGGDIILLDEPTDDLDDDAVAWFERELLTLDRAVVIASHDRVLLDHWPEQIVMIDAHAKRIVTGPGPLTQFEQRHARLAGAAERDYAATQRRAAAAERAAAARAAQAMSMHRVDLSDGKHTKNEKAYYNERAGGLARSSRVLRERDARNHVAKPWRDKSVGRVTVTPRGGIQQSPEGGGVLARISNLRAGYNGIAVTDAVDLTIERGERIVITGPNGAGKTTLLCTLTGELAPVSGQINLGPTRISVLEQRIPSDLLERTALEIIELRVEPDQRANARLALGALLVRGRDLQRPVTELSEGSRRKVLLAALLASGADLLLLDEPANHLDLQSRDALAEALEASPTAILMTSHDRAMREQIATRMIKVHPQTRTT